MTLFLSNISRFRLIVFTSLSNFRALRFRIALPMGRGVTLLAQILLGSFSCISGLVTRQDLIYVMTFK